MCVLVCKREEGAGEGELRAEGVHIEPCVGAELGGMCAELLLDCKGWLACLILQGDKISKMGGWWLAFFFFFFFLSFSSFAYELRGAVYQSWKMPQRGPDQRQALNCILRWIFLPNTLMRIKHKFHKQLFSICLTIVLVILCTIDSTL